MTYAFVTEWMEKDDVAKFDRELADGPVAVQQQDSMADARRLMAVFQMATADE